MQNLLVMAGSTPELPDYIHYTHSVGKRRSLQLKVSCNSNLQGYLKIAVA